MYRLVYSCNIRKLMKDKVLCVIQYNIRGVLDIMKKIVLYGTGYEGEKFFYSNYKIVDQIAYCIDAAHEGFFHGIPIVTLEKAEKIKEYYIYVAAIWETYEKIKRSLEELGLIEYLNFSWGLEYNKKVVVINANCHGRPIEKYLLKSKKFLKNYIIHHIPQVQENKEIDELLLKRADVYIHQDIRKDNSINYKLSDEYIIPKLNKDCKKITIPNLYGTMGCWMFPQHTEGVLPSIKVRDGNRNTFYKDTVLEELYENNIVLLSEYVKFYKNYKYEEKLLNKYWEEGIQKLQQREEKWDIKISDYILENYKKVPCFVDIGHPSMYIMLEIGKRLAKYLDIDDITYTYEIGHLGLASPILPCVKEHFKINYGITDTLCERNFVLGEILEDDLSNYIREYLWWSHNVMFD
mgnify:CR=1 FL=1